MIDDSQAIPTTEAVSDSAPPVEEAQIPEVPESDVEVPVDTDTSTDVAEPTEETPHKGVQARIDKLTAKAKTAQEEVQGLKEQLAALTGTAQSPSTAPPFDPQKNIINPGEEIDGIELNKRLQERENQILAQADARAELRNRQNEAVNRINAEASQAVATYPELDKDSELYVPELSDAITEATMAYVEKNPYSASPKTFIDKMMKPYRQALTKQVGQASEAIARQASQAAQRPTAVSTAGKKDYSAMTTKELEAELGIIN